MLNLAGVQESSAAAFEVLFQDTTQFQLIFPPTYGRSAGRARDEAARGVQESSAGAAFEVAAEAAALPGSEAEPAAAPPGAAAAKPFVQV